MRAEYSSKQKKKLLKLCINVNIRVCSKSYTSITVMFYLKRNYPTPFPGIMTYCDSDCFHT